MSNKKVAQRCSEGNTGTSELKKSRTFCFTNYDVEHPIIFNESDMRYLIQGYEICPSTGRPHLQGYMALKVQMSRNAWNKKYGPHNCRYADGDADQNKIYCSKDGKFTEFGKLPISGERNDLEQLKNRIIEGTKVDEITMENPMMYHQYGRTLERIETIVNRGKYRTWMTEGIWLHGKTGSGKSHAAFQGYNPEEYYIWNDDNGWWDGYKGQEIVIINDFRGQIKYGELLNLIDKWPHSVPRRNHEPWPFLAKKVIITSSLKPQEVYNNLYENDKIDQLLRRLQVTDLGSAAHPST